MNDTNQLLQDVTTIIKQIAKSAPEQITLETNLPNLGLSSVDRIRLVVALEKRFDIDISQEEASRIATVEDLVDFVGVKALEVSGAASG